MACKSLNISYIGILVLQKHTSASFRCNWRTIGKRPHKLFFIPVLSLSSSLPYVLIGVPFAASNRRYDCRGFSFIVGALTEISAPESIWYLRPFRSVTNRRFAFKAGSSVLANSAFRHFLIRTRFRTFSVLSLNLKWYQQSSGHVSVRSENANPIRSWNLTGEI